MGWVGLFRIGSVVISSIGQRVGACRARSAVPARHAGASARPAPLELGSEEGYLVCWVSANSALILFKLLDFSSWLLPRDHGCKCSYYYYYACSCSIPKQTAHGSSNRWWANRVTHLSARFFLLCQSRNLTDTTLLAITFGEQNPTDPDCLQDCKRTLHTVIRVRNGKCCTPLRF